MNFNSLAFLLFLPTVVGMTWLLPHRFRKYWLLAASWFFYAYWNPLLLLLNILPKRMQLWAIRTILK